MFWVWWRINQRTDNRTTSILNYFICPLMNPVQCSSCLPLIAHWMYLVYLWIEILQKCVVYFYKYSTRKSTWNGVHCFPVNKALFIWAVAALFYLPLTQFIFRHTTAWIKRYILLINQRSNLSCSVHNHPNWTSFHV